MCTYIVSDAKFEEEHFSNIDLVISISVSVLQKQAYMYVAFQMHVVVHRWECKSLYK